MNKLFSYQNLNQQGVTLCAGISEEFDRLLALVSVSIGNMHSDETPQYGAREFALLKTKLEEASFYAKKCFSLQPKCQSVVHEENQR